MNIGAMDVWGSETTIMMRFRDLVGIVNVLHSGKYKRNYKFTFEFMETKELRFT